MLGLAGALTLIASAHGRITAPRVACQAKAAAAAKAAGAASGAAKAAKAAGVATGAANAAKAAGAASGAAKTVGAVAGSAGSSTMYKAGAEADDSTNALNNGRKFFPQDRGTPEYEEYMRQLRKQKEEAWETRTARNPDGNFGGKSTPKKGDLYDPLLAGEESWLDTAKEGGLYAGEFLPEFQVGVTEPLGFFDPLSFTKKGDKAGFSKLRAAEIKHGRVAMMASVGAVVQHYVQFPGFKDVPTGLSAVNTAPGSYGGVLLFAVAGALELSLWKEKSNVEPGNYGDPLGFDQYTEDVRNRELNNGRFAMFAALGIIAAELLTGKDAVEQFGR